MITNLIKYHFNKVMGYKGVDYFINIIKSQIMFIADINDGMFSIQVKHYLH